MIEEKPDFDNKNKCIEIKSVTWKKDSHGLFDYESKNILVKKITKPLALAVDRCRMSLGPCKIGVVLSKICAMAWFVTGVSAI